MPVQSQQVLCLGLIDVLIVCAAAINPQPVVAILFDLAGVAGIAGKRALVGAFLKVTVKLCQQNNDAIQLFGKAL